MEYPQCKPTDSPLSYLHLINALYKIGVVGCITVVLDALGVSPCAWMAVARSFDELGAAVKLVDLPSNGGEANGDGAGEGPVVRANC